MAPLLGCLAETGRLDFYGDEQQIEDDELSHAIKVAHIDEFFDLVVERDRDYG